MKYCLYLLLIWQQNVKLKTSFIIEDDNCLMCASSSPSVPSASPHTAWKTQCLLTDSILFSQFNFTIKLLSWRRRLLLKTTIAWRVLRLLRPSLVPHHIKLGRHNFYSETKFSSLNSFHNQGFKEYCKIFFLANTQSNFASVFEDKGPWWDRSHVSSKSPSVVWY